MFGKVSEFVKGRWVKVSAIALGGYGALVGGASTAHAVDVSVPTEFDTGTIINSGLTAAGAAIAPVVAGVLAIAVVRGVISFMRRGVRSIASAR